MQGTREVFSKTSPKHEQDYFEQVLTE